MIIFQRDFQEASSKLNHTRVQNIDFLSIEDSNIFDFYPALNSEYKISYIYSVLLDTIRLFQMQKHHS